MAECITEGCEGRALKNKEYCWYCEKPIKGERKRWLKKIDYITAKNIEEKLPQKISSNTVCNFKWHKKEYEIVGSKNRFFDVDEYKICPIDDNLPSTEIQPLLDDSLHIKLATVNSDDHSSVINFVNEYGVLGQSFEDGTLAPHHEKLSFIAEHVSTVSYLSKMLTLINEGENGILKAYDMFIKPKSVVEMNIPKKSKTTFRMNYILYVFTLLLNDQLKRYTYPSLGIDTEYPFISNNTNNKMFSTYGVSTLVGAIYFQLFLNASNRSYYKNCLECSYLFIAHRSDNNFCSDKCRDRYYKREERKRKKNMKQKEVKTN